MKTIRWGIIGTGDVAEYKGGPPLYHLPHSELVAVMSRNEARVRGFADRHGVDKWYVDVDAMLEEANLDAVYVATPPNVHLEMTEKAADRGIHVLLEKPMAHTVAECEAINKVVEKKNIQLIVAYYRRFFPVVVQMKAWLDEGAIGRPIRARAMHTGFYDEEAFRDRAWLIDPAIAGGGFMTDAGIHRLDLFSHLFGEVKDVTAYTDIVHFDFKATPEGVIDDSSTVICRFDQGVHATAEFNWNVSIPVDEFDISGTHGRILSRNLGKGEVELIAGDRHEKKVLPPPEFTHLGLVHHFNECIRTNVTNQLSGDAGMQATRITNAAYTSSRERRTVGL